MAFTLCGITVTTKIYQLNTFDQDRKTCPLRLSNCLRDGALDTTLQSHCLEYMKDQLSAFIWFSYWYTSTVYTKPLFFTP